MRIRHFSYVFIVMLLVSACASTTPRTTEALPPGPMANEIPTANALPAEPEIAVEKKMPEPTEIRATATALRTRAFDLGLRETMPEAFLAADVFFAKGAEAYGTDNALSAESYSSAGNAYKDILEKGLPQLASSWRKKAQDLGNSAKNEKADTRFPDLSANAQDAFMKAAGLEEGRDFEGAIDGYIADCALDNILIKLCDAQETRTSIIDRDFAKWDPSNWSLAEEKYSLAQSLFWNDRSKSLDAADEAALRYRRVVDTAIGYYAADRKAASESARGKADGIKAQVAAGEQYDTAVALYDQAIASDKAGNIADAGPLFAEATEAFEGAYSIAVVKMDHARSELDELDGLILAAEAGN